VSDLQSEDMSEAPSGLEQIQPAVGLEGALRVVEDPREDVPAPPAPLGTVVGALGLAGTGKAIARNTSGLISSLRRLLR